ncbi:spore germination protein [Alicyclobacillus sp. SO9]|uniref:spore germination protein n=1 Tax=Alicyclobacillus sp. SO9 TaxID=2665646 RepID=UPI0018E84907|nr:spore germination protein [Alicyclobacillus sp. SO9]QQE81030.1 spore germination protein [Alicyclobacillus sp. SO9]
MNIFGHPSRGRTGQAPSSQSQNSVQTAKTPFPIPPRIDKFKEELLAHWTDCDDFRTNVLELNNGSEYIVVTWLTTLVDRQLISNAVFEPITQFLSAYGRGRPGIDEVERRLTVPSDHLAKTMEEIHQAISEGKAVIYVHGHKNALMTDVSQVRGRNVDVSQGEPAIQGPQAAFIEQLDVNIAQVRRIVRDARLKIKSYRYGAVTHTKVSLLYVDGVTNKNYITETQRRLENVKTDSVIDSNHIRELIRDSVWSPFPLIETSERPDKIAAALSEGRIVLIVDGSPNALIMPVVLSSLLTASEDYYGLFVIAMPIRILRHIMFWTSILLPSLYVSLLTFNQDLVPTPLLINLEAQHEGIPFPTLLEALIMQFSFEALREAGVRLPRAVGQSVSIVGALIIGEAAVTAGLVSPGMVIVVAATGVASFTLPDYSLVNAVRVIQFVFLLCAGFLGLFGVMILGILLVLHLLSLRSLAVPYLAPVAPGQPQDFKDVIFRTPFWNMKTRPSIYAPEDRVRSRSENPISHARSRKKP